MVSQKGGRWDVGTKDNAVYLARVSESDERLFDDVLAPDEARDLAGLLTKYADKAAESGDAQKESDESDRSDESDDAEADESDESDEDDEDDESDEDD